MNRNGRNDMKSFLLPVKSFGKWTLCTLHRSRDVVIIKLFCRKGTKSEHFQLDCCNYFNGASMSLKIDSLEKMLH